MNEDDQVLGKNDIVGESFVQLAPTFMKKDSPTKFLVVAMAPGLLPHEIKAKIIDGERKLLLVSGQSGSRGASGSTYSYDLFQQYVLLPEDVEAEEFEQSMHDGLFTCSFAKKSD